MNLYSYFMTQPGLQMIKNAHYFQAYERHLQHWVNRPVLLFEIGTGEGGSSLMWKQYFGPLARIVTIDIRECRKKLNNSQIFVRIGDQSDEQFLESLIDEFGKPDIVIDDGSHQMKDVNQTFSYLYPRMTRDGVYIVEDLNTAYWEEFGGGVKSPDSFIERCKALIDELNAMHTRDKVTITEFSKSTSSIHFYNMLIVFERAPYQNNELLELPRPILSQEHKDTPPLTTKSFAELCTYDGEQFIHYAYWTLLGRQPDPDGLKNYSNQLNNGVSKAHILAEIKSSPEGMRRNMAKEEY